MSDDELDEQPADNDTEELEISSEEPDTLVDEHEDIVAEATPPPKDTPIGDAPFTPKDIPITVSAELGRLDMNAQTLMDLRTGNILDLNVLPENGIDLVIGGKRVGKAEVVRIGEKLGLRVLQVHR